MKSDSVERAASEELALIDRALAGDEPAAQLLVRRLMPILCARVRTTLAGRPLGPHDLEDIVQEIWLALFKREGGSLLRAYDPTRGATLEGYVGMIARREAGNIYQQVSAKKRGAHLTVVADRSLNRRPDEGPTPEQSVSARDLAARLGAYFEASLPEKGLVVLRYAFVDGLSPHEVARVMGVSVQVVYNWQHKIRELARAFLAG